MCYNQGFLQSGVTQSGVLKIRGTYNQGFLQSRVLTVRGLTIRGSSNQGSYNQGFLQSGVLQSGVRTIRGLTISVLTIRGLTFRGSCNQGSYNQGSYNQEFISVYLTWQLCAPILILIPVLYIQGSKSTCLTRQVCAQILILIVVYYIQRMELPFGKVQTVRKQPWLDMERCRKWFTWDSFRYLKTESNWPSLKVRSLLK